MFAKSNAGSHTEVIEGVHLKTTVYGKQTLMSEVKLEKGAVVPLHKHSHEQTGYLLSGQMEFIIAGERLIARPGDSWCIASQVEHGATAIEDSLVIEVFSPLREDYMQYFETSK